MESQQAWPRDETTELLPSSQFHLSKDWKWNPTSRWKPSSLALQFKANEPTRQLPSEASGWQVTRRVILGAQAASGTAGLPQISKLFNKYILICEKISQHLAIRIIYPYDIVCENIA